MEGEETFREAELAAGDASSPFTHSKAPVYQSPTQTSVLSLMAGRRQGLV